MRAVRSRGFVCGKNYTKPLTFLLNVDVTSHFLLFLVRQICVIAYQSVPRRTT